MSMNLDSPSLGGLSSNDGGDSASTSGFSIFLLVLLGGASLFLLGGSDLDHRIMLCLSVAMVLLTSLTMSPELGVVLTLSFAALLGGIKRWLIPVWGFELTDPLMLVLPSVAILIFGQQLFSRRIATDTPFSKMMVALLIILVLEIVNPLQGGIAVGLAGALFWVIPVLWYFIGRNIASKSLMIAVVKMTLIIGVGGGLYGLYQQFFGLLDSELMWIHKTHWILGVGSTLKVFSIFCSTAEYAQFIGLAAVISFVGALQRRVLPLMVCIACLVMAFISSNRTLLFVSLATFALLWAVQGKTSRVWGPRLLLAVGLAIVGLYVGVNSIRADQFQNRTAHDLVQHEVDGIADPLGKGSTGGVHVQLVGAGIGTGFRYPFGTGLGTTNMSADRVGGSANTSGAGGTENDISNMFTSAGLPGGILYVVIIVTAFRMVIRQWMSTRESLTLCALAILSSTLSQWLNGGHYSQVIVVGLTLGYLDKVESVYRLQTAKTKPVRKTGFARFTRQA